MVQATTTTGLLDGAVNDARRALESLDTLAREPSGSSAEAAIKTLTEAAERIAALREGYGSQRREAGSRLQARRNAARG